MPAILSLALLLLQATLQPAPPAPYFTSMFPREEFAARRAKVMQEIGGGVAVLQGAAERPAEAPFRQNNQVFYLTGIEAPRAIVVIDGGAKRTTVYLPDAERRSRQWGTILGPTPDAAAITGVEAVEPREAFEAAAGALEGRTLYTPMRPEVLGSGSGGDAAAWAKATAADPWDGRVTREQAFVEKLTAKAKPAAIKDLDPILDAMRFIKSPREIAVIREATRITGLGIMEAMREAEPGKFEYELFAAAEYVFRRHGAQGAAYFPLSATGRNTIYSHYHRGTAKLADGDLVQFDYAPDFHYYVSDVTRVFPANGRFTPWQREYYTTYLRLYRAVLTSIRPNVPVRTIIADAVAKMDQAMAELQFTDTRIREAASRFIDRYRKSTATSLGHTIGMEVHDVTRRLDSLQAGQVFTIEPPMPIPELGLGLRLEDAILVTETGCEILSAFVPIDIEAIEKVMREPALGAGRR